MDESRRTNVIYLQANGLAWRKAVDPEPFFIPFRTLWLFFSKRAFNQPLIFFFFHLVSLLLSACIHFLILKGLNWVEHKVGFLPALLTWSYSNLIFSASLWEGSATWVNLMVSVWARPEAYFFLCRMNAVLLTPSLAVLRLGNRMSIQHRHPAQAPTSSRLLLKEGTRLSACLLFEQSWLDEI